MLSVYRRARGTLLAILSMVAIALGELGDPAWGQSLDGPTWLDPSPLELIQGKPAVKVVLINPTRHSFEVRVESVGPGRAKLSISPTRKTVPPFGRLIVSVAAQELGQFTLVAWGDGFISSRNVVVADDEMAPVTLVPDLALSGYSFPLWHEDASLDTTLPLNPDDTAPACPDDPEGHLVGRIGGPNGHIAVVCTSGRVLTIFGADRAGSWAGSIDLDASDPEGGDVEVSVSIRDFFLYPVPVLLAGLLIALYIPLTGVTRSKLTLRYYLASALEQVDRSFESTTQAVRALARDTTVGIDRLRDTEAPLFLDVKATGLLASMDAALDAEARAQFVPPSGETYKPFKTLVDGILDHYALTLSLAQRAARLGAQIDERFPGSQIAGSPILRAALRPTEERLDDEADWLAAQRRLDQDRGRLERFQGIWNRIGRLSAGGGPLSAALLKAADDTRLTEVENDLAAQESAGKIIPPEVKAPTPLPSPAPDRAPPLLKPGRSGWKLALVGVALVVLVAAVLPGQLANQLPSPSMTGSPPPSIGSGSPGSSIDSSSPPGGAGGASESGRIPPGIWLAVATIIVLVVATFVSRRKSADESLTLPAPIRSRIKRLDRRVSWIGGVVVFTTGYVTLYLQDATFGGVADYLTLATWGFTLGAGVNVAKRFVPSKAIEIL